MQRRYRRAFSGLAAACLWASGSLTGALAQEEQTLRGSLPDDPVFDEALDELPSPVPRLPRPSADDSADTDDPESLQRLSAIGRAEDAGPAGREADREPALEQAAPRAAEQEPYAPVGIRLGIAEFYPSAEQGVEWSRASGEEGAFSSLTTARLRGTAASAGYEASVDGSVTWRRSLTGPETTALEGSLDAGLRLRLGNDHLAAAGLSLRSAPEGAESAVPLPDVERDPQRTVLGASLSAGKDEGPLRYQATGTLTRQLYGTARLSGGGTLSQKDRDNTLYALSLRGGYAISPALTPFVEGEIGRRVYDQRVDAGGYRRSGNRYGLRAGLAVDMGEKFVGEVSAGWLTERADDERLEAVSGPALAASLAWSPLRGTVVTVEASSTVEGTTTPGASGSILHAADLSVTRRMRADLEASALVGLDYRDYSDSTDRDLTLRGEIGLTWWLNRWTGLVSRLSHERLTSTLPGRDTSETTIYLGLRAQR